MFIRSSQREALERFAYNKTAQAVARISIACTVYLHILFGIPNTVRFMLGLLRGRKHLPQSRIGSGKLLSALFLTPVFLATLYAVFLIFKFWISRMWFRSPGLFILVLLGFVVIFLSLYFE